MREYALLIFPPCNPPFIYYQLLPEEEIYLKEERQVRTSV